MRRVSRATCRSTWPATCGRAIPKRGRRSKTSSRKSWWPGRRTSCSKRRSSAKKRGHPLIRVEDVHDALQMFQPHDANQYEDIIYFPRLPKSEQIVIEAYDLDSFRDPGIHWVYLNEALQRPALPGHARARSVRGRAARRRGARRFGVLVLRVAGKIATEEEKERLESAHLTKSLDAHPEAARQTRRRAAGEEGERRPSPPRNRSRPRAAGKFFTDVTATSGIAFEHRMSDWLARFIRGYTVVEGNTVRLCRSADVRRLGRGRGRHRQRRRRRRPRSSAAPATRSISMTAKAASPTSPKRRAWSGRGRIGVPASRASRSSPTSTTTASRTC